MARAIDKSGMREAPISEIKDGFSRYLHEADSETTVITRHGEPAERLVGFEAEDDGFEYRLEHVPRSLKRIEKSCESLRPGRATRLSDVGVD